MMDSFKTSRCGFVVIKLVIDADIYFVMRRNQRWSDLNFIADFRRPATSLNTTHFFEPESSFDISLAKISPW